MIYRLPTTLNVNGKDWKIRTDFRDVMTVIYALNDPNLENKEKAYIVLYIIYEDFDDMKDSDYKAAFDAACAFINHGSKSGNAPKARMVDFEQDEHILIPAINRIAGQDVRGMDYLHWWTFLGYFMEIGDCTYSHVLNIRQKRSKGKALDKWETEFFASNKDMIIIQDKLSDDEIEEYEEIKKLLE